jgi:hypothetical protein
MTQTPTATASITVTLTPSITPTNTPTPTPGITLLPGELVDNFDNDGGFNDQSGAADAQWWWPQSAAYQLSMGTGPDGSPALCVNMNAGKGVWDYVVAGNLNAADNHPSFATKSTLEFDQFNRSAGAQVVVKFRDVFGRESGDLSFDDYGNSNWNKRALDLTVLDWQQCDRTQVKEILFFFPDSSGGEGHYQALDNIRLSGNVAPPPAGLIDNFDNDHRLTEQPGYPDSTVWSPETTVFTFAPVNVSPNAINNTCLQVNYAKPTGEEWAYLCLGDLTLPDNQHDFTGFSGLQCDLQSAAATGMLVKFRDAQGRESADAGVLTTSGNGLWQTLGINLSGLNWQTCDKTQVKEILFFPQPGTTGSGQLKLDNIKLVQVVSGANWVSSASVKEHSPSTALCKPSVTRTTTPTAVPTRTPTPTPTQSATTTVTSTASPTARATSSPTATQTPTTIVEPGLQGNEYLRTHEVLAFPNPAHNVVMFAWNYANAEKVRIDVYNLVGNRVGQVMSYHPDGQHTAWVVKDIAPGIYLYRIVLTLDGKEKILPVRKVAIVH